MTITLIILAYIASVFLNRWLNYLLVKKNNDIPPIPFLWFFSLFTTISFMLFFLENHKFNTKLINWFTGKHW